MKEEDLPDREVRARIARQFYADVTWEVQAERDRQAAVSGGASAALPSDWQGAMQRTLERWNRHTT